MPRAVLPHARSSPIGSYPLRGITSYINKGGPIHNFAVVRSTQTKLVVAGHETRRAWEAMPQSIPEVACVGDSRDMDSGQCLKTDHKEEDDKPGPCSQYLHVRS
jgi:hypothetical protein